jgi:MFS family permease
MEPCPHPTPPPAPSRAPAQAPAEATPARMDRSALLWVTQPSVGFFSDKLGRRRTGRWPIVLTGAVIATVPFALIPWATDLPVLLLCVVGFAAFANAFKGVAKTLVTDYLAPSHRSRAQGFIKAGVSLTIVVSSLISLLVVDRSLGRAFVIRPSLMLIMIGLSWSFLGCRHAEAVPPEQPPTDIRDFGSPWAVLRDAVRSRPARRCC